MAYMILFLVLLAIVVSKLKKWYERRRAARTGTVGPG